jgi:hypothetical protein
MAAACNMPRSRFHRRPQTTTDRPALFAELQPWRTIQVIRDRYELNRMKLLLTAILTGMLAGCASSAPPESMRATQAMTDMDGRPIDPGPASGLSVGVGFGSWGAGSGIGVGIGRGW